MDVGCRLRLINDPGRVGVFTGQTSVLGGRDYVQVAFPDQTMRVPLDQVEPVDERGESPIDLLRRGRLARPIDLYRTLTHIRLAGRLANFIYSLDTTDTDFYAYQFKPVLKLLQSSSTGILVADEVGLGKTIEAGLVWTELRSRFDLQRLLVICPAMLRDKWKRELQHRFGVTARICGAEELVETLAGVRSGETRDYALVASLQGLRPPANWDESEVSGPRVQLARILSEGAQESPLIDLLIIDEAHYLKNPETRTFELGSLLRRAAQFAVLLSATPVHLHSDDLFHLLRIVDEDVFNQRDVFEFIRQANERLVTVRDLVLAGAVDTAALREHLTTILKHPLLKGNRQLEQLLEALDAFGDLRQPHVRVDIASRLEAANLFGFAVTRTRRREVKEWRAVREAVTLAVQMNELECEFYRRVTETVRAYCARENQAEGFLLVMPQRQVASSMAAAMWAWSQGDASVTEALYEELGIDLGDAEVASLGPLVSEIRARVSDLANLSELTRLDTKYTTLRDRLVTFLREKPREKVVLFSSFRATLRYLRQRLLQDGVSCALLLGGDSEQQATLESFASSDGPSVLLSSEVGSEGIDLQFAWVLVNYDLPWNPMKVEQRIGRLDRLGQQSLRVSIWNIVHADTIDERIYSRLLMRLGIFERTLGGLEVVLGERINALTRDLMQQHLTPAQESARIDQTAVALENVRQHEEVLEREAASLVAYGDYILQQVEVARSLSRRVKSEDTQRYVLDFLGAQYSGCRILRDPNDATVVSLDLSPAAKNDLVEFLRQRRSNVVTALTRNDPTPVRCRFDDRVKVIKRAAEEIVNQFHPLVRFVAHRSEAEGEIRFPAIAARVPAASLPIQAPLGEYWLAVTRWTFEALRVSEQLWFAVKHADAGQPLSDEDAERFVVAVAESGDDWNVGAGDFDGELLASQIEESLLVRAWEEFERHEAAVRAQNEDRADAQVRSLETHLHQQRAKYEELRSRHVARGNPGLARAQEVNIERLTARIQRERLAIEAKREVRSRLDEICIGIVSVY
jgi:superfamily II DNA or RNA helicase